MFSKGKKDSRKTANKLLVLAYFGLGLVLGDLVSGFVNRSILLVCLGIIAGFHNICINKACSNADEQHANAEDHTTEDHTTEDIS